MSPENTHKLTRFHTEVLIPLTTAVRSSCGCASSHLTFHPQPSPVKADPAQSSKTRVVRRKHFRLGSKRKRRRRKAVPSTVSNESSGEEGASSQTVSQSEDELYQPASRSQVPSPLPLPSPSRVGWEEETTKMEEGAPAVVTTPDSKSEPSSTDSTPNRPRKRKRIPYTLVEASKGNRCPTPGCDGMGHTTGLYAMHFAVSGCPKAHGKTPEECRARREALNRLRVKSELPAEEFEPLRSVRRTARLSSISSGPAPSAAHAPQPPPPPPPRRTSTATVRLPQCVVVC